MAVAVDEGISVHFYPRPPRGGRHGHDKHILYRMEFLSTSSARRTTVTHIQIRIKDAISIHVLREEDDWKCNQLWVDLKQFLSTSSARRTTVLQKLSGAYSSISIHVLREEDDLTPVKNDVATTKFLSTSSARRTTLRLLDTAWTRSKFLSTSSARRTTHQLQRQGQGGNFYPRPPRGGRQIHVSLAVIISNISIHVLREEDDQWPTC